MKVLPFGRYRGELLRNVPAEYLCWLLRQKWVRRNLYVEIQGELIVRGTQFISSQKVRSK